MLPRDWHRRHPKFGLKGSDDRGAVLEECNVRGLLSERQYAHIAAAIDDERATVEYTRHRLGEYGVEIEWTITYKGTIE